MKQWKIFIFCLAALTLLLASSRALADIKIDETHFPDPMFRLFVSELIDEDGSGSLSEEEIEAVEGIDCSGLDIGNLTGIECFPYLTVLYCDSNKLFSLDVSGLPFLSMLSCTRNYLTELDVSQNPLLMALACDYNTLGQLDVSQNPYLMVLSCERTNLSSLDLTQNPLLTALYCQGNPLGTLDLSQNPNLKELRCWTCQLTSLDVSHNLALQVLHCSGNRLTSLDLSSNTALTDYDLSGNSLSVDAVNGIFDLSTLPGFEIAKASGWLFSSKDRIAGATLFKKEGGSVYYFYDCGNGISMQCTLWVYVHNVNTYQTGDVTADGVVDGRDALRLMKYLAGQDVIIDELAADVNGDWDVDGRDVLRLMKMLAGQ